MAQDRLIAVTKEKCNYDTKYTGEKIILRLKSDTSDVKSSVDYWLDEFINLPDSTKLGFIGKLLAFEHDTSLCCMKVVNSSFNGIEGCGGKPRGVTRYPIQVDALYIINRICWPRWMELYSCSPVLYDNKLDKSINDNPAKIKIVYKQYKEWYNECRKKGEIGFYFPFNKGRYGWYNGRVSGVPK
ncbi:hypothetical protein [Chitinophaga nivalis]|uniref:Uncharacterized protein n=1 Tax=Chitinophaga nivalis TaxID=2991709 RepID=A0ABT3IGD5_9BACT|nr:hypothetical protein [Chitinophaga nivalis]MCW3467307.1 hypothetical protein [Chitinophaga nivalis]MCW3483001.1 hypothetical protein [Chitinophaga nivalis]